MPERINATPVPLRQQLRARYLQQKAQERAEMERRQRERQEALHHHLVITLAVHFGYEVGPVNYPTCRAWLVENGYPVPVSGDAAIVIDSIAIDARYTETFRSYTPNIEIVATWTDALGAEHSVNVTSGWDLLMQRLAEQEKWS